MSTQTKPLVFVTGAAGYLGFEVVHQLLQEGYAVRGAARGRKLPLLKKAFDKYPQFEAVEIADVSTADYEEVFKGVEAIIHTAAPLPGRADSETAFNSAIEGSLHILREAHKSGIKKFVATGSMVTFPNDAFGSNDWVPITKEQALEGNAFELYTGEKKFAEQAVLEFADQHPEMDITIFSPPWIFGPFAPGFEDIVPEPDFAAFSTNLFVYQLLRSDNKKYHYSAGTLDVRDVARAHIAGLNPVTPDHPKRVPIVSPHQTDFRDAINYIAAERPALRSRLADPETVPRWSSYKLDVDLTPVDTAFGIKLDSYKTWKETILDSVDRFLEIEQNWTAKGLKFEVPTVTPEYL